jgi:hypothetical protein
MGKLFVGENADSGVFRVEGKHDASPLLLLLLLPGQPFLHIFKWLQTYLGNTIAAALFAFKLQVLVYLNLCASNERASHSRSRDWVLPILKPIPRGPSVHSLPTRTWTVRTI